jgi:hypothetical protein
VMTDAGEASGAARNAGVLAECGHTVYIVCNRCNRFVVAKLQEIAQHVGWRTNAQEAGKRLRCKECKHVGAGSRLNVRRWGNRPTIERQPRGPTVVSRPLRMFAQPVSANRPAPEQIDNGQQHDCTDQ